MPARRRIRSGGGAVSGGDTVFLTGGDPVYIGPNYGETEPLEAGTEVNFKSLVLGPFASLKANVKVAFKSLVMGPFAPLSPGVAVGGSLSLGPFATPVAGVAVAGELQLGPFATPEVGTVVGFDSARLGPFVTPEVGTVVSLNNLVAGPFAAPKAGVAVGGTLVVTDLLPNEDTYFDEALGTTPFGSATVLVSKTDSTLGGTEQISYIAWDLTGYVGTTINVATIDVTLRTTGVANEDAPFTFFSHGSKPFEEDTATWDNTQPPPGTSHQTGTVVATTGAGYTTQTITLDATATSNMPGNWVYLLIEGAVALGLTSVNIQAKENSSGPTMDLEVSL